MIIVASKPGQLGNRLWLAAHFIAYAAAHDSEVSNLSLDEYAWMFEGPSEDLLGRFPPQRSWWPGGRRTRQLLYQTARIGAAAAFRSRARWMVEVVRLDWEETLDLESSAFRDTDKKRPVVLAQGWLFTAERALRECADLVRRYLRPVRPLREPAERLLASVRRKTDVVVGVHVRRGDYRSFRGGQFFYGDSTYESVMRKCRDLFPSERVAFVVCSNERHDLLAARGRTVGPMYPGPGSAVGDMYALSGCDLIVGPPSTFSMWSSFAGNTPIWVLEDPGTTPDVAVLEPRMSQLMPWSTGG